MAFVPGHKHDLFLSYAHIEAGWAEAFLKTLCDEFQVRTGKQVTVWHDAKTLRLGQKWTAEIEDGIRSAAAFLAIVSPSYLNSPWCTRERGIALEKKLEALKVELNPDEATALALAIDDEEVAGTRYPGPQMATLGI